MEDAALVSLSLGLVGELDKVLHRLWRFSIGLPHKSLKHVFVARKLIILDKVIYRVNRIML